MPNPELFQTGVDSPGEDFVAVTPDDNADLTGGIARALYIGSGAGKNIAVITRKGNAVTIPVADNFYLLLQVKRVKSTGTDASNIFAIY